jgi:hypothetical protein
VLALTAHEPGQADSLSLISKQPLHKQKAFVSGWEASVAALMADKMSCMNENRPQSLTNGIHELDVQRSDVGGNVFVQAVYHPDRQPNDRLVAYEHHEEPPRDMTEVDPTFTQELIECLQTNNLASDRLNESSPMDAAPRHRSIEVTAARR